MPKLQAENITKRYPTRADPIEVLCGVSLVLDPGQNLAILGPSGSGKSTLMSILGTLETPTSGRVLLDGVDPAELDERQLAAFRNRRIGFVFQDHYLLPQCSVLENVLLPAVPSGPVRAESIQRAEMLLQRVGLANRHEHRPAELSGGERQRAALARALINSPDLLLADEPTGNLDHTTAQQVGQLLLELQKTEPMILIVVTHSQRLAECLQTRLELDAGRLQDVTAGR
ncbi:MAG: ABC transporter ATP-binding protein [Thermoguttaceae bacterium]